MPAAASSTGSSSPRATSSTLYVLDADEKPVSVEGGSAKGQVLIGGKTHNVDFKPAGGNTLKATGDFTAAKGMTRDRQDRQGRRAELSGTAGAAELNSWR